MGVPQRILLVEDDPDDVELTLGALGEHSQGNDVIVARDGGEALDYLHCRGAFAGRSDEPPAMVLLDLKMPRMDGMQVLQHIRSDQRWCRLPVVVLTSSREERDLERCYALGANAYVVKPVRFTDFERAIKEIGVFWGQINEPPPACQPGA